MQNGISGAETSTRIYAPHSWSESTQSSSFFVTQKYLHLSQHNNIQAQYVWIGGSGQDLRSKTKTLVRKNGEGAVKHICELPIWNYDGSSTAQAEGNDSEVLLVPVKFIPDPFRLGNNIIVLCEAVNPNTNQSVTGNNRTSACQVFERSEVEEEEPWYGIEQEYILLQPDGKTPLGFPEQGFPAPQGPYYCSVGTGNACGRQIAESHYRCCLYSGLTISGINAEVMCGQWEYQIGPVMGIDSPDQLWLSRYLLHRVCEDFGVKVTFEPKPIKGDWNGSGCHTNYSTKSMRAQGGIKNIWSAIEKLGKAHQKHMDVYGEDNRDRLTGSHETAAFDEFSAEVAHRGSSIRVPRDTEKNGCGYFEDRRPAANMDPYLVTSIIAQTTILD